MTAPSLTEAQRHFWANKRIVALSGGVGGARLVDGLSRVLPNGVLTVIANTGDDFTHRGLWISPDIDTLMYTLADLAPIERGWGIAGDTFSTLDAMRNLGEPDWFQLGDRDLATHILRTEALRNGESLTTITQRFTDALKITTRILPMADAPHPTQIEDTAGTVHSFQDWLVKLRARPTVSRILLGGDTRCPPAVIEALDTADLIILPPSNPFVSIDPILRLDDVRTRLRHKPVIGVSPIIHGRTVKGPLDAMICSVLHTDASASAIADYYADILDIFVVAIGDAATRQGIRQPERDILMQGIGGRRRLGREIVEIAETLLRSSSDDA